MTDHHAWQSRKHPPRTSKVTADEVMGGWKEREM